MKLKLSVHVRRPVRGQLLHVQIERLRLRGVAQDPAEGVGVRVLHVGVMEQVRPVVALGIRLPRPHVIRVGRAIELDQLVVVGQFLGRDRRLEIGQRILCLAHFLASRSGHR